MDLKNYKFQAGDYVQLHEKGRLWLKRSVGDDAPEDYGGIRKVETKNFGLTGSHLVVYRSNGVNYIDASSEFFDLAILFEEEYI